MRLCARFFVHLRLCVCALVLALSVDLPACVPLTCLCDFACVCECGCACVCDVRASVHACFYSLVLRTVYLLSHRPSHIA